MWLSDPQGGTLWECGSGSWQSHELTSQSNGLWIQPDGTVVGSMLTEKRIGLWNGKAFGSYADLSAVAHGPLGDMVGDSRGGLYVDDVGYAAHLGEPPQPGALIYVTPNGASAIVAATGIEFPNGLALIDNGATLVVAETWNRNLLAFDVRARGELVNRRVYADLAQLGGTAAQPDGICAGNNAGVWVATLGAHKVLLIDESTILETVNTGAGVPIACAIEPDGTLWVTVANPAGRPFLETIKSKTVTTAVLTFPTNDILNGARKKNTT